VVSIAIFVENFGRILNIGSRILVATAKRVSTFLDEQRAANLTHQNLAPIYEELADAFVHAKDKVVIAKVDADGEGKPLGKKYGVTGYPSRIQSWRSCLMFTEHSFSQLSCGSMVKAMKSNTQVAVTLTV